MSDLFKPCPFCGSRTEVRETFGRLVAGCSNQKCNIRPDTWLTAGEVYDVRVLAKHWNKRPAHRRGYSTGNSDGEEAA